MKVTTKERKRINKLVALMTEKYAARELVALSNSKNEKRAAMGKKLLRKYLARYAVFTARELTIAVMLINRQSR